MNNNPLLPYQEEKLPSGVTLVHKEVNTAPIVAIDIWVHTGAIHDPEPHFGLSHFFEHMFFKGTEKHGVGVMDQIITSLGGYNNAATSLDYTHYYVVLPSPGWEIALDVLLDSLQHPLFDGEEIDRERDVIIEEIKQHEDNPWAKIYDEFTSQIFANNRYSRQVLGTVESLHTISQETFFDYHKTRYAPDNITICVTGDVPLQTVRDKLNHLIEPRDPFEENPEPPFPVNTQGGEVILHRDVNQSYLLLGYPTECLIGTKHEYALDLLSNIIGEGRSSRLHHRLSDELGLVSSISCNAWMLKHAGVVFIEAVCETSNLTKVEEEINNEINQVRDSISLDDLYKAKSMARADFAFSNEKAISIAHSYGLSRVVADINHSVTYLQGIEKATLQDIHEAFDTYITPQRQCQGRLLPKS